MKLLLIPGWVDYLPADVPQLSVKCGLARVLKSAEAIALAPPYNEAELEALTNDVEVLVDERIDAFEVPEAVADVALRVTRRELPDKLSPNPNSSAIRGARSLLREWQSPAPLAEGRNDPEVPDARVDSLAKSVPDADDGPAFKENTFDVTKRDGEEDDDGD